MKTPNDGGPAFPEPENEFHYGKPGMTLRQWYAGQAMSGLIAARLQGRGEVWWTDISVDAFEIADAMIAHERREKEQS